jgi:Protein of unknown function (DUF3047)
LTSPIGAAAEPAPPWQLLGLPRQVKPLAQMSVIDLDGQRVLRIEADRAYGALVHRLQDMRSGGSLAWRWRVDRAPAGADLQRKSGDDSALKVCALFDMPLTKVPFFERQLLRIASWHAGEALPTATLCYVWDANLPQGTLLHNAYTHRLRYIVTHGTPGQWRDERHDLAADFRRAFGDDWGEDTPGVPPLAAIAIGADSDNTGSRSLGYIADLRFNP